MGINKILATATILLSLCFVGCGGPVDAKPNIKFNPQGEGYAAVCVIYLQSGTIVKDQSYFEVKQSSGPCCPHCVCGDDCKCSYPGECLIKKNNGWPVCICNETSCTSYYPKDSNGNDYNPYDYLSDADKRKFPELKKPVCVDKHGNKIQVSQTNQYRFRGCVGCGS